MKNDTHALLHIKKPVTEQNQRITRSVASRTTAKGTTSKRWPSCSTYPQWKRMD